MKKKNCILVGAGDFSPQQFHITKEDYLIAVDGGYDHLKGMGIIPNHVIGDFDSTLENIFQTSEQTFQIEQLPVEKDDTDLLAGIKHGLSLGLSTFHIYGGLGGMRFSHSIGNIQCLIYLHKRGKKAYLHGNDVTLTILENETLSFPPGIEGEMSLFAMDETVEDITLEGFKYPLNHATLTYDFPLGISNEFTKNPASIHVGAGMLLAYITNRAFT